MREIDLVTDQQTSSSRIRVLFVIGTMGGGGAERQVVEILKRLDRTRFEPFLYLAMKQGELLSDVPADVPIHAFWDGHPEPLSRRILRWLKLTRIVRYAHLAHVLRELKIDIVYDRTYLATLDSAGGCFLRPTPRISCCVVEPEPELLLHARISKGFSWWFARRAYASADVVLANSQGLRNRMIEYFKLDPDRVRVLYNLLTNISDPNLADQPTRSAVSGQPFLIVSSGRLHPQKGQIYLLQAILDLVKHQNRAVRLVLLGQGESESLLRDFIRTHDLQSNVELAGFVSNAEQWYRQADLFVLSSLYEGMPNSLIEAVACGAPALSTDCPSGPFEILDGGQCGRLVPPADSAALASAIADAMDHREEWMARAELARKRVLELFDPQAGIQRLEQLLEQTAKTKSSPIV